MKKHTKVYMDYFNYTVGDYIACEICKCPAVDIHHIDARGMGGSISKDIIENLMALCRDCHIEYGDKKNLKEWLQKIHFNHIDSRSKLN